jgi:putative membrane protein
MIVALKFLHVTAIALWSAGLLALPFLYRQRRALEGEPLHRIHAFTRRFYVLMVSPAAFIAIGTGTALIFYRETFTVWFSLKLLLVGVMVVIHITSGMKILNLFEPEGRYSAWRATFVTTLSVTIVSAILSVVLAKPQFGPGDPFGDLFAPGRLGEIAGGLISWAK